MKFQSSKRLKNLFSNVDAFRDLEENSGVDELACGLVQTPSQRSDNNIVEDVSNFDGICNISYFPIIIYSQVTDHLFDSEFSGEDLIAINIQRSRDNGIKGYVEYRSICRPELGKATKFQVHSHA